MKNRLVKIAFANILLAAVLMSLSCADVPQNKTAINTPSNNTVVQNTNKPESTDILEVDCSGDAPVKKQKIKDGIKSNIDKDNDLKYQLKKRFDFEPVVDSTGDAVLYIWGNVFTSAKNLNQLNKTYESFVKKGCVTKVVFDKAPGMQTLNGGFEFELCEAPLQICPDGTCQQTCISLADNENPKTNSNANPKTNSNTNSNTNLNTNSNANKLK